MPPAWWSTAPVKSSTTLGTLANPAVTSEFTAIATAAGFTALLDATVVSVSTTNGVATYSVVLTSGTGRHARYVAYSVDASGNPVGDAALPLSVFSMAIQNALVGAAPSGATALTPTSTILVKTTNGLTTYSATYLSAGSRLTVSVNAAGMFTSLPSTTTTTFSAIPTVTQTELQTLATAKGVTTTIAPTQVVSVYSEGNGLTIYTVKLSATNTTSGGTTYTYYVAISADQLGNPSVLPFGGGRGGFFGGWCV